MLTELSSVESFLTQAVERATTGEWEAADELLLQTSAVLEQLIAPPQPAVVAVETPQPSTEAPVIEIPQPAIINAVEVPALKPAEQPQRAFAAAA